MSIYSIYKATNKITRKSYIGFDSNWPRRKNTHRHKYQKNNSKFYSSIKKHGWDNFEWSILYQSKNMKHCLNEMETHFIKEFDSYNNGYNMTLGGEAVMMNRLHTKDSKLKMSKSRLGGNCVWSEKTKELHQQRYIDNGSRLNKNCLICNKEFISPKYLNRICCGRSCAATYRNNNRKC